MKRLALLFFLPLTTLYVSIRAQNFSPQPTLFRMFPDLATHCGYVALGTLPTPLHTIHFSTGEQKAKTVLIKRDDLMHPLMGSNKLRKLSFILGHAQKIGAKELVTFGKAGSNHAAATAYAAQIVNIPCHLMLLPQRPTPQVTNNLLLDVALGAHIHFFKTAALRELGLYALNTACLNRTGIGLYEIVTGGSNEQGAAAFVDAVYELADQLAANNEPAPDRIYLPCSSAGTTAGLVLGCAALDVPITIVGVLVEKTEQAAMRKKVKRLFKRTKAYLRSLDPSFPDVPWSDERILFDTRFSDLDYAQSNDLITKAMEQYFAHTQAKLDQTYSGKAWAALMQDLEAGVLEHKTALFWHTFCSHNQNEFVQNVSYKKLPEPLWRYFNSAPTSENVKNIPD